MTAEYQKALLNLLLTDITHKKDLSVIPSSIFVNPVCQTIMDLLKGYVEQFKQLPHEANLQEYWRLFAASQTKLVDHTYVQLVVKSISEAFAYADYEPTQVKQTIDGEVIRAKLLTIVKDMTPAMHTAIPTEMPDVLKEVATKIALMGNSDEKIKSAGYLHERPIPNPTDIKVYPCFLSGINKIRNRGGFHTPNSVILKAGPKAYKTTFLVNFAMHYVGMGLKVYYADAENGHISIEDRCRQMVSGLTEMELIQPENSQLIETCFKGWFGQGGVLLVDSYKKGRCSMADVKYRLEEKKALDGFVPDVIIFDYIDEFIPINAYDRKQQGYQQSQIVYNEADALMQDLNTFYISVTPENRSGEIGGDYKKIYNCWSIFELQQDEYDEAHNIVRVVSLAQREGKKNRETAVKVYPEVQQIQEVPREQWLVSVEEKKTIERANTPNKRRGKP